MPASAVIDARSATRAFWTYWSAGTISGVGSAITAVALPLTAVSVLEASAFEVSLVAAASYVAWIVLGLPAGVICQRLPLRGTQVAMDLTRAVAIGSIPAAWWLGHLTVAHLIASALLISFANVLFDVSNATFLPSIVNRDDLAARNSLISGTHATTQLGGPSLGGLLVQLAGAVTTLVVDAVSYLLSAMLLLRLPPRRVEQSEDRPSMGAMIRDGWRFVTRHPVMGPCMRAATAVNFVCGAHLALIPLYLVRELGASPGLVGLLLATDGLGTLVGAALTPRLSRRLGSARAVLAASVFLSATALLMPIGESWLGMVCFGLGNAAFAGGVVVLSICTRTHRQVASPPDLLSRVMATVRFVSWGAIPVGSLAAGAMANAAGPRTALWVFCALAAVTPAVLLASPVRHRRDLGD